MYIIFTVLPGCLSKVSRKYLYLIKLYVFFCILNKDLLIDPAAMYNIFINYAFK